MTLICLKLMSWLKSTSRTACATRLHLIEPTPVNKLELADWRNMCILSLESLVPVDEHAYFYVYHIYQIACENGYNKNTVNKIGNKIKYKIKTEQLRINQNEQNKK